MAEEKQEVKQEDNKKNAIQIIAEEFGKTKSDIQVISTQLLKGGTADELRYFLNVAKIQDLNPFTKEIVAYKDFRGNLIIVVTREGFRKIAQRNPNFSTLISMEVCENDEFEMGMDENLEVTIKHQIKNFKERGRLLGAYAVLKGKNGEKSIEWADLPTYYREFKKDGKTIETPWTTYTVEMIKKVAETHAIRKVNNIAGVVSEEEYESMKYNDKIINIDDSSITDEITKELSEITNIEDLNSYYDNNKEKYDKKIFNKLITDKRNELENLQSNGSADTGMVQPEEK